MRLCIKPYESGYGEAFISPNSKQHRRVLQSIGTGWKAPYYTFTKLCEAGTVLCNTVRTRIIEPSARTLELPLLARTGTFLFFALSPWLNRSVFAVLSLPYPREGISDPLARGSIIPVLRYSSRLPDTAQCSHTMAQPVGYGVRPNLPHLFNNRGVF